MPEPENEEQEKEELIQYFESYNDVLRKRLFDEAIQKQLSTPKITKTN